MTEWEPAPVRHLYVHIPFCRSRCSYCDFASEPVGPHLRAGRVAAYVERLRNEVRERTGAAGGADAAGAAPIETVYLGGGTPTVMPEELLLPLVADLAALQAGAAQPEFTIEANPGTIDAGLLDRLTVRGVTRLSLGVQSFAPALRAALGRRTGQEEIEAAVACLRAADAAGRDRPGRDRPGIQEWNIDLVFGIPGQTWADAAADIDAAVAAGPTHISLYDLTYTPGYAGRVTRTCSAGAQEAAGAFTEEHLTAAAARLAAAGYERYEVSNFALPGHECRHNVAYWRGEDYLGIGASAVSTVEGERRTNPVSVAAYLAGEPPYIEVLSPQTRLWERAMLGLRTDEGVALAEVAAVLDARALDRLLSQDCLRRRCGRLRLNPAFLDVSNAVISALLVTPEGS
jgi:oxygen-independent coproporphyrinogen III oxidase